MKSVLELYFANVSEGTSIDGQCGTGSYPARRPQMLAPERAEFSLASSALDSARCYTQLACRVPEEARGGGAER